MAKRKKKKNWDAPDFWSDAYQIDDPFLKLLPKEDTGGRYYPLPIADEILLGWKAIQNELEADLKAIQLQKQKTLDNQLIQYEETPNVKYTKESETKPKITALIKRDGLNLDVVKATTEIVNTTVNRLLEDVYKEVERRSNEAIFKAEEAAEKIRVIAGVTVNNGPVREIGGGGHEKLPTVVSMMLTGLTPLLVGPKGCGKTLLAGQCAVALDKRFGHLCFSAGVSETWLFGRQTPNGFVEGEFSKFYRDGGVFLADELDAADPNLLLAINTALSNNHFYNPISGEAITRHPEFYFIGAANTLGKGGDSVYTGRSRLDAATLDRFIVIKMGYCPNIERKILPEDGTREKLQAIRTKLEGRGSMETLSYRSFDMASKLLGTGMGRDEVIKYVTASIPQSLLKEIGHAP